METVIFDKEGILLHKSIVKSTSFNNTKVVNEASREVLMKLISKEFYSIPKSEYWRHAELDELVKTALNLGFSELAAEMTNYLG